MLMNVYNGISALTCIIGYVKMQHNLRDYKGKKSYH